MIIMQPPAEIGSWLKAGALRTTGRAALALLVICPAASILHAEKLVVFKNGKAMRAVSVVEEGPWLKCEFGDGNYAAIPRRSVESIEEAALLPPGAGSAANQLVDGPRGAANFTPSSPGPEISSPSVGAGRLGRNAPAVGDEGGVVDEEEARRQALEEEAEALRGGGGPVDAFGRRSVPLNNVPIQGLQPLVQPAPNQAISPTDGRRGIGRKRDRGNVTQLPGQSEPQDD